MKKITVFQIKYFLKVVFNKMAAWKKIAACKKNSKKIIRPDFEKRLREIFGDRILKPSNAELISMLREERF